MLYLWLRFEWRFAIAAIVANMHDVVIILGFFALFQWEEKRPPLSLSVKKFWNMALRGFYPELIEDPKKSAALWHGSYMQTYLERDVRSLRQIGDLSQFQLFLRAIAIRSAQIFQISDVARDIGVAVNTIKAWLSVLEATYMRHSPTLAAQTTH